jgi:hypothetical protein
MQAVYLGGSGITGLGAGVVAVDAAVVEAATPIQWLNVAFVTAFPLTVSTALPGTPPHAYKQTLANKTAPSAEMKRNGLDTTRAL